MKTEVYVWMIALLIAGLVLTFWAAVSRYYHTQNTPLETGLCPVEVVLPLPRGGNIRYHAELSCVELDAMAREEVDNDAIIR